MTALDNIKAALEAGPTEGPWTIQPHDGSESIFEVMADGYYVATAHCGVKGQCNAEENAAFIAACNPTAIRELLAYVESLEKDAGRLDWLETQGAAYGFEDMHEGNTWSVDGPFMTVRDAIDAAMEQTK